MVCMEKGGMKCYQIDLRTVLNQWPVLAKLAGLPEIGEGHYTVILFDTAIVNTSCKLSLPSQSAVSVHGSQL